MRLRLALLLGLAMLLWPAAASAGTGGASAPTGGGGTEYGTPLAKVARRPVATTFRLSPRTLTEGRLPRVALRIDQRGVRTVTARIVLVPLHGKGTAVRLDLGTIRTGRTLHPDWPEGTTLVAGRYVARVHARSPSGATLRRRAKASGRTTITVRRKPAPKPAPQPLPPAPLPTPDPGVSSSGVFPVAGPHSIGGPDGGFGAGRPGHIHEGVDVAAAEGTPVIAPLAGTIIARSYQASAAGYYLAMDAVDGRSFFFAHCQKDSFAVTLAQPVAAGQPLCRVGQTGSATGPHLHFEIWLGGWRRDKASRPVDPLAQLLAWDR